MVGYRQSFARRARDVGKLSGLLSASGPSLASDFGRMHSTREQHRSQRTPPGHDAGPTRSTRQ